MCSVIRRLSRGLVRHPRHHLLNNEPALGPWPLQHDFIDYTMKCRSSSTGSLWLWQALSFMMPARDTSTLFISGFRLTTMRLSRRFRVGGLLFGVRMAAHLGRHCPGVVPATLPSSAASRAASRRRRAPRLPAPSSMAPSTAWP